jgi:hypothetical protein
LSPQRVLLASGAGFVLESVPEIFEMHRAYAFWFYFYDFSQPLAEELS